MRHRERRDASERGAGGPKHSVPVHHARQGRFADNEFRAFDHLTDGAGTQRAVANGRLERGKGVRIRKQARMPFRDSRLNGLRVAMRRIPGKTRKGEQHGKCNNSNKCFAHALNFQTAYLNRMVSPSSVECSWGQTLHATRLGAERPPCDE